LKDTSFIISFGLLIYFGFATVLGGSKLMGSLGITIASLNHNYFGYISYIYIFLLLFPLYKFYKDSTLNIRILELFVTSFLILFSSLLAQAMLIENEYRGEIAGNFVDFLSPYIGMFGLWVFWLIITMVSVMMVLDKSATEIFSILSKIIINNIPQSEVISVNKPSEIKENIPEIKIEKKVEKEFKEEFEKNTEEYFKEEIKEDIDKPAYLRREEKIKKENSVINIVEDVRSKKVLLLLKSLKRMQNF
jgi:S-DNA-T family DNA segregation ATPase FtsK/SpoIIIE